jgi:redox-sensitive bicupin YhaK (pirin superfamily)
MIEVIDQRRRDLGGGMEVGRVLPYRGGRMVGPFIFFDHMGPVRLARGLPREFDVRPHPHIGLSTVTYLFSGQVVHRDSLRSEQPIEPGEVNWMVAGAGITHSERFERARAQGDVLHGIQSWVALPREYEECAPQFAHHAGGELPVLAAGGVSARLIAGEAFGLKARVTVHSPLFYVHWELMAGASVQLPAEFPERALYIAAGTVQAEGRSWHAGQMLIFAPYEQAAVTAVEPAILMGLGGEPLGPRFIEWNFVSSSKERIEQAKADWRAGRMKLPDLDNGEFIPLP